MFAFADAEQDEPVVQPRERADDRPQRDGIEPVDLVEDMLSAMNRLSDLLEVENDALRRHRHDVTNQLQDEKAGLCRLYVQRLKQLAEDTMRLEQARAERGEEMRESAERLKNLSDLNATLLKSAMAATQRFLDSVMTVAREHDGKPRYARNGKVAPQRKATALSYNQTL